MTEAAIDSGITRDLYVSMGEQVEGGAWIVRFYYKPFVNWIWGGCVVMVLGGLLAATDRRYRRRTAETDESLQPLARRIDALPQGAHKEMCIRDRSGAASRDAKTGWLFRGRWPG